MKRSRRLIDDWQARITGLERLRQTAPEWNWLWDIRLQVLRFLRSRYADRDVAQRPPATETRDVGAIEPAPFEYPPHDPERDTPRMSREEMREILEEIHEIAQCSPLAEFDDHSIEPPQRG